MSSGRKAVIKSTSIRGIGVRVSKNMTCIAPQGTLEVHLLIRVLKLFSSTTALPQPFRNNFCSITPVEQVQEQFTEIVPATVYSWQCL